MWFLFVTSFQVFQSQTRRLLPRNPMWFLFVTSFQVLQSQTRRLLPRNTVIHVQCIAHTVSIADATLASPQHGGPGEGAAHHLRFNRRRDACFPATSTGNVENCAEEEFQSQTRRLLPRNTRTRSGIENKQTVSIADATLASPQLPIFPTILIVWMSFNRRRDACFPATMLLSRL